jgi:hypothetical protein
LVDRNVPVKFVIQPEPLQGTENDGFPDFQARFQVSLNQITFNLFRELISALGKMSRRALDSWGGKITWPWSC